MVAPCSAPYFERLGFVTLAWMCLSSFGMIGVLLVLSVVGRDRAPAGWNRTRLVVLGLVVVLGIAAVVAVVATGGDDSGNGAGNGGGTAVARDEVGDVTVSGDALAPFTDVGGDAAIGETIPTLTGVSFDSSTVTIEPAVAVATCTDFRRDNYPPSRGLRREGWSFPVLVDSEQATGAAAYGLAAFPYFVFVDADGTVAGRPVGELSTDNVRRIVDALLAGEPLPAASGASSRAS